MPPTLDQLITEVIIKDSASAVADRIGDAAERSAKKVDGLGASAETVDRKVTGSTRSLEASAKTFESLKRSVDPVYDSQVRLADVQAKLQRAVSLGTATQTEAQAILAKYKEIAGESVNALNGLGAAHGRVRGEASRMREGMVLVHEFLRGDFKRAVGSATIELGNFGLLGYVFNPVTLGIIGFVAAIGLMLKATADFETAQGKLAIALKATGDAVGFTRGQLDAQAQSSSAASATLSIAGARAIQTELLAGGRIGGDTFTRLISITEDYAKVTGESADKAAGSLSKMFLDPAKGAKELDASLNLLTAAQLHEIDSAQKSGDVERARGLLLDALTPRIKGASEQVSGFAFSFERLTRAASNAYNALAQVNAPQTIDQQIARLKAAAEAAKQPAAQLELIASGGAIVNHPLDVGAPHPDRLSPQGLPATLGSDDAAGLARQIGDLQRIRGHQEDDASAEALAAANRDIGKSYDELAQKLEPLIQRHRDLTAELSLVDIAFKAGIIGLDEWNKRASALQVTLTNLRDPLDEARKRLDIERQVDAAVPSQRPALRARLTAEESATQNPATAGQAGQLGVIAGQAASDQQLTAARDAVKQAGLQADAEQRLATAAGSSSEAMRKATVENQVAAFAYQHGAAEVENYRKAVERTSAANQAQQINATVLGLNQQADASARVAAVSGDGAAAVHRVTIENQAFAEALKAGAQGSKDFADAYQRVLEALQRRDATDGEAAIQKEVRAREDALAVSQRELELIGGNVEKRGAEVALLREKLRLQEQFPTATQDEIDKLTQLAAAEGKVQAEIKKDDAAERDFQQIARQGIGDVTRSFEDMIINGASLKDTLAGLEKSLLKLGFNALVEKPLNQFIDKSLGSGGLLSLLGLGDEKASAGSSTSSTGSDSSSSAGGFIGGILSFFGLGGSGGPAKGTGASPAADRDKFSDPGNLLADAATDLTNSGEDLTKSAKDLGGVPSMFQSLFGTQLTTNMNVEAASVTVISAASAGGGGGGLGGLLDLFGGGGQGGGIAGASGDASLTSGTAAGTSFEAGGMGAFTSEAAMVVAEAHSGGVIGEIGASRNVPWTVFAGAPRFHEGFDLGSDEVPAILQRGERVLNRQDAGNYRGMMKAAGETGSLAVHIGAINVSGGADPNMARRTGTQMGKAAAAEMRRAMARNS